MSQQFPSHIHLEFNDPWRTIYWSESEKQNLLETLNSFQLDSSKVDSLRILPHGHVGSGKSSFINSVDSTFKGRIATRAMTEALTGPIGTLECESYKMRREKAGSYLPFTLIDSMGMCGDSGGIQTHDIIKILKGHIKNGYKFKPLSTVSEEDPKYNINPDLKDKIHCLVCVILGTKINLLNQDIINQMREIRKKARDYGIPQVIIMTMVDNVCPLVHNNMEKVYMSKTIKQKMEMCSNKLGVPMSCIFPVKNYHEEDATNTTMEAFQNIVTLANDYCM